MFSLLQGKHLTCYNDFFYIEHSYLLLINYPGVKNASTNIANVSLQHPSFCFHASKFKKDSIQIFTVLIQDHSGLSEHCRFYSVCLNYCSVRGHCVHLTEYRDGIWIYCVLGFKANMGWPLLYVPLGGDLKRWTCECSQGYITISEMFSIFQGIPVQLHTL